MAQVSSVVKDFGQNNLRRVYNIDGVDLASIAANTTVEVDLTVTGVTTDDRVIAVVKPALEAGLVLGNFRVKAADTVSVTIANVTASPIDAASEDGWEVIVEKD